MRAFLMGGGPHSLAAHRPFADAVGAAHRVVVYLLDEPDAEPGRWSAQLAAVGLLNTAVITVSDDRPPIADDLDSARGVYVAGGLTPGYRKVMVGPGIGTGWLSRAKAEGIVYGGFSAGSAIAGRRALIGGWRATVGDRTVQVAPEECGEDLDELTISEGLGIVPFLIDVHAAQWGTLQRLVFAVRHGRPGVGWALDEDTALEVVDGVPIAVHGSGAATLIRAEGDVVVVRPYLAGQVLGGPGSDEPTV
jgi:cyanophycinase